MDATGARMETKKFIAAYNKEYTHDPENAFAALGYDTVFLMADAIKRANGTDSAAVKTALRGYLGTSRESPARSRSRDRRPRSGVKGAVTIIDIKGGKPTLGAKPSRRRSRAGSPVVIAQ